MPRLMLAALLLFLPPAHSTAMLESGWISTCDGAGCYGHGAGCRIKVTTLADGSKSTTYCYFPGVY
jgi:hypothetical protein